MDFNVPKTIAQVFLDPLEATPLGSWSMGDQRCIGQVPRVMMTCYGPLVVAACGSQLDAELNAGAHVLHPNELFLFDVFLSHNSKDKVAVRDVAQSLRADGLRVWFDEWEIKPGDSILAKVEEGLENSRVLVLFMSANAFNSDWAQLEAGTFRFRDPLNKERRFIPLRLDEAPIKGSVAQFLYIRWRLRDREHQYAKLLEACRPPTWQSAGKALNGREQLQNEVFHLDQYSTDSAPPRRYAFSPDGKRVLTCNGKDWLIRLWDIETGQCLRVLSGQSGATLNVAWSTDQRFALSCGQDWKVRLWDMETGYCLSALEGHEDWVFAAAWSDDMRYALSGGASPGDQTMRLWSAETGRCLQVFNGHTGAVRCVALSPDTRFALSGSGDKTVRLWEVDTGRCLRVLEGHREVILGVAWSADQRFILTCSDDKTVQLWEAETGRCLRVLEGHRDSVLSVAWSADQRFALSSSVDRTVRLWHLETGLCMLVLEGHESDVGSVAWSADQRRAFSGDSGGCIRVWDLSDITTWTGELTIPASSVPDQIQYVNAKVLLVGESGAGKTGLSKVLAGQKWQPSDSTVGAWATQWKLPVASSKGVEREIWLWDFGGQADQRLIHQLYMDETALAVLVFDGQKEDLFEMLGQWDRDLTRASRKEFAKLLVAGRVDAGGLRVSRTEIEKFAHERKFGRFLETSAKTSAGCEDLGQAILDSIKWDDIPCRTTEVLFKRLKEEIVRLKDAGRVLMRFNELRDTLQLRVSGKSMRFTDEELHVVLTLLAGPGVVWELSFGNWVLLQPERINAYAQAVIRTLQADDQHRGYLMEERVLKGDLAYESSMPRLEGEDERFVLLAMHQTLVERGLCLRQPTNQGNLLIFPSYYRRERPEQVSVPAVLVSYLFTGFLDEIYATLVVLLHHTGPFQQDHLWRYAADFKTNLGKQLGVKLTRCAPGMGELEVYFDSTVGMEEKIIFSKYVHEHLLLHAQNVERLRHYLCPHCDTPVGNREVAMKRLNAWLQREPPEFYLESKLKARRSKEETPSIVCADCEKRVPIWDDLEQCFASPDLQQRVRDMQEESAIVLDNESKERALVGEVISTVALAGQISREFNVSDHGIDMEIEFKDDGHEATGAKLYLQLKSGDSYLRERKSDNAEIFTIKDERHARYWMAQQFPVLLVIRGSDGEVRWMEVQEWLKRASDNGKKPVTQIVFAGERFDVMSVRRWRDRGLNRGPP